MMKNLNLIMGNNQECLEFDPIAELNHGFHIIKSQTALHHAVRCTVTCNVVHCYLQCSALLLAVRYGYVILWAVLMQFL